MVSPPDTETVPAARRAPSGSDVSRAIVEASRIAIVGLCIAIALGVLRGVPSVTEIVGEDATSCAPPVASQPTVRWIEQAEARDLVSDHEVTFVDARPREAYEAGHIAGAVNVSMETGAIDERSTSLVRGARMVVAYDDTSGDCASSTRLAGLLAEAGLPDVRVLRGGMPQWLENDSPAEAGPCRVCP